jgi:hypothetical protein
MLRMVAHSHRPQSGHFMCYLDRTYRVLLTCPRFHMFEISYCACHQIGANIAPTCTTPWGVVDAALVKHVSSPRTFAVGPNYKSSRNFLEGR